MAGVVKEGKIQIYTGDGKGKTTAAFGLAARCAGCGGKVLIIQFQKRRRCGEHISAAKLGIEILQCGVGRGSEPCARPCPLFGSARRGASSGEYDLVALDEVMAALRRGCVSIGEVLALTDARSAGTELVMTGRSAPAELTERADLVTEMKKIKHYYDEGTPARRGVEF